ncbi:MAG: hypothetical protein ACOX6N_04490 [Patescibacteria group bacterium]|jgi:hypothetical protein
MNFALTATIKRKINIKELEELATEKAMEINHKGYKKLLFREISPTHLEISYKRHPKKGLALHIENNGYSITSIYCGIPPNAGLGHYFLIDLVIRYGGHIFDWGERQTHYYSLKTKKWSEPEEFDESLLR